MNLRTKTAFGTMLALLGTTLPALAELPPQYTRWADLQAITEQSELANKIGEVDRIEAMPDGTYRVQSGSCFIPITIVRKGTIRNGQPVAGPSRISDVRIGEQTCE